MSSPLATVLVVDDEPGVRIALHTSFVHHGWNSDTASSVREAVRKLEGREFDLLVTDVRMPDGSGTEILRMVRNSHPKTAVLLLTAYGNVPEAVEAIKGGALDYLTKPVTFQEVQAAAARLFQRSAGKNSVPGSTGDIIGYSPSLLRELERARAAALAGADVLIQAESGTGKELLARYIHKAGCRAQKPFVAVNCAAVPETLLESELFGHSKGAFTGATVAMPGKFELAHGGVLLLDEVGEMPLHLQPKLLRVLQEREIQRLGETRSIHVDLQVIATTNVTLIHKVETGQFRSDLYYRLNVIPLSLPPLRQRPEDIERLVRHFAREYSGQMGMRTPKITDGFVSRLSDYDWPGNVRELANFMRRILALYRDMDLDEASLEHEIVVRSKGHAAEMEMTTAGMPIRQVERKHLEKTLALTNGNRTHAAEMLGISLRTLRNKIREYELPPRRYA